MLSPDMVNVIGITAYTLVLFLFFWVVQIPGASAAGFYWMISVVFILFARINLLFFDAFLDKLFVQSLYAAFLNFEKLFLIFGFLVFLGLERLKTKVKWYLVFFTLVFSCFLTLLKVYGYGSLFSILFSLSQAFSLLLLSYLCLNLWLQRRSYPCLAVCLILVLYAIHWSTFYFALSNPNWLAFGYLFGNLLNVITYIFYCYLELYSFQVRLVDSEHEARALAEEAMQASQAKSDFLANMSHEIRTPMNGVLGMLSLLQRSNLDAGQQRKVKVAFESGQSLLMIINEILDFSKIEAGKMELELVPVKLHDEFDSCLSIFQPMLDKKGLDFIVDIATLQGEQVYIDSTRLRQILTNLLNNAIKFTDKGSVSVRADLGGEGEEQFLFCKVSDTGIGIDNEKIESLFGAFQQADTSTTRVYGGTGLGLTICKKLCDLMGGDIKLSSVKGEGSCFSFCISAPAVEPEHKLGKD
ncbi:sensor histidine kinase [Agaribacterium sp. ZY112]|uniref:sensor histidine kinase n=1 Tax=Agaribacterium sp. ZY112 TaxID=3233574 RepID=UPI003526AF5B